ncbi:hypothetical protein HJG53_02725 [Sphingomonas sp. ID1715]|nr:hypothetical protein [Sphingomonas sp. ID1715]NNM75820.1 hypothetical protein [Sphingomonas sp. ID1715]
MIHGVAVGLYLGFLATLAGLESRGVKRRAGLLAGSACWRDPAASGADD